MIVDGMYGMEAVPKEETTEVGDNNTLAVNTAASNISSGLAKGQIKEANCPGACP